MKDYFIKDISAETKFEPIERRNGVYVATFLLSETEGVRRIATARYASEPTEEQVQTDFAEWETRHTALLLNSAKQCKLQEITAYNTSDNVDAFLLNGEKHWLTRDERAMAKLSTEARQRLGHYTTEQCLGGKFYTIPCDTLLTMLARLEDYALCCFNFAIRQQAEVNALTSLEEVEDYDVTKGYPEMLNFTI